MSMGYLSVSYTHLLYSGIAGGADVILLPEIPYSLDKVVSAVEKRAKKKKRSFAIIAVAEGSMTKEESNMKGKERAALRAKDKYQSISYRLADQIQNETGFESRVVVPGHFQRGGSPSPYDRVPVSYAHLWTKSIKSNV